MSQAISWTRKRSSACAMTVKSSAAGRTWIPSWRMCSRRTNTCSRNPRRKAGGAELPLHPVGAPVPFPVHEPVLDEVAPQRHVIVPGGLQDQVYLGFRVTAARLEALGQQH